MRSRSRSSNYRGLQCMVQRQKIRILTYFQHYPAITLKLISRTVLQKNGSVIDATISAMFCLGLTSMQSMGIGGGFLMNFFIEKEGKAYTINARERAPIMARNESYNAYKQKDKSKENLLFVYSWHRLTQHSPFKCLLDHCRLQYRVRFSVIGNFTKDFR